MRIHSDHFQENQKDSTIPLPGAHPKNAKILISCFSSGRDKLCAIGKLPAFRSGTTYEQLKQEGASRVLIRLLSKKFPGESAHLAALLSRLDPEQQDELSERILEARTVEEIREWLQSVRHN